MLIKTAALENGVAEVSFPVELPLDFEGAPRPKARVQYYGPFRDRVSMANISVQFCRALLREFGESAVAVQNYVPGGWIDSGLEQLSGMNRQAPVAIFYGVPPDVPELVYEHPVKIGGFVCETDLIEKGWVRICNRFDLIIVPSRWCRDAFLRSGVSTPIMVVPHGLEPEYKPYGGRPRSGPFIFYNTFYATSFHSRKSLEELVRSFIDAFQGRDDVLLRLRTDNRAKLEELQQLHDFSNLIRVDPIVECGTEDFARIYSQVHCTVHPSKGEGFGMVPFQSIACETPVIAPHTTGMADYLSEQNSIRLNTSGRVAGEGVGNSTGTYFAIDEHHLTDRLRYVVDNWRAEHEKVKRAGPPFRQRYRWDNVLLDFIGLVRELLAAREGPHARIISKYVDGIQLTSSTG